MGKTKLCHCGKPLHYLNPAAQSYVEDMVKAHGPNVKVTAGGRTWLVQRHYIALHGLKAGDLPNLGFEEITPRCEVCGGILGAGSRGSLCWVCARLAASVAKEATETRDFYGKAEGDDPS